jgi:hypothetical protein
MEQSYYSPHMAAQPHVQSPQTHASAGHGTAPQAPGIQNPQQPYYHPQANTYYYQQDGAQYGYAPAVAGLPMASADGVNSWFDFSNTSYLKGLLIGAGVTLLVTNSAVQKALVRGSVKLWSFVQGGVEEVKEQFHDIKAEMSQEK